MRAFARHMKRYSLIYLGMVIYLLFYISVQKTGWFDFFFSGAALHIGAKGIDLFQVPKGAWAFWHGGELSGDHLPSGATPYAPDEFSNGNVYHPFFTLTVGSLMTLFAPDKLPYVWLWTKFAISLVVLAYFFRSFRANKYISFALFVLMANLSIYLELTAWQFHFFLNIFLLLFLIAMSKKSSPLWASIWYWLGLLIKPVGLLLAPALLLKGRWRIVLLGIWLFGMATIIFVIRGSGNYYTSNLMATLSSSGSAGPNQIITLSALLHYTTHWPDFVYQALQNGWLLLVVFLSAFRRTHIAKAAFLIVVYYLCFYESVFEYQWSTLAYVTAICIVTCPEFQTKRAIFCILLTCLPDCFALLNFWHIDVKDMGYLGLIPGPTAWEWMVVSKVVPLLLLLVVVVAPDMKPIFKESRLFWQEMRKVNARLKIFGAKRETPASASTQSPADTEEALSEPAIVGPAPAPSEA